MRKILCFLCAILVACNATITASATSRIVENLDDDFLVRERITLTGEKIPARDFVLLINLRDIEDIDFLFATLRVGERDAWAKICGGADGEFSVCAKEF